MKISLGRYFNLETGGVNCRIYVEEAGQGIPLVCLHTAGSDARQFRHILCDREITANYRVIAFDAPWHGKSNPPPGWQDDDYQLTSAGLQRSGAGILRSPGSGPACVDGLFHGWSNRLAPGFIRTG